MRPVFASIIAVGFCMSASVYAAPSASTIASAENIRAVAGFLDQSSRLALTRASRPDLKRFARDEAAEQTAVANAVVAWSESSATTRAEEPARVARGGIISAPLRAAGAMANGMADQMDDVETGRSVAVDTPPEAPQMRLAEIVLPSAKGDLARLESLRGRAFDALYTSVQHDALLQLSTIYAAYIQDGHDSALRALAIRELPKVNRRLADLRDQSGNER